MNTPEERATLAAVEHYDRRVRAMMLDLRKAPFRASVQGATHALEIIARARAAELRDPEPSPYTL